MKSHILSVSLLCVSLVTASLLAVEVATAEQPLPTVQVTQQVLGGAVLLIEMKHTLVIERGVNERVLQELGEAEKKKFFHDIVMSRSVEYLRRTYAASNQEAVSQLISQYETLFPTGSINLN